MARVMGLPSNTVNRRDMGHVAMMNIRCSDDVEDEVHGMTFSAGCIAAAHNVHNDLQYT